LKPATRLTPPIVVRGSRSEATVGNELASFAAGREIELEVGVRCGSECEDPCLGCVDAPIVRHRKT
jgi:hypothetical protein